MIVTAILLAYEQDIPGILPAAFYTLHSVYTPSSEWNLHGQPVRADFRAHSGTDLAKLSKLVLLQFLQGREWLRLLPLEFLTGYIPGAVTRRAHLTERSEICESARQNWWKEKSAWHGNRALSLCPLSEFEGMIQSLDKRDSSDDPSSFCDGCRHLMKQTLSKAREYLWIHLPAVFELVEVSKQKEIDDPGWYFDISL